MPLCRQGSFGALFLLVQNLLITPVAILDAFGYAGQGRAGDVGLFDDFLEGFPVEKHPRRFNALEHRIEFVDRAEVREKAVAFILAFEF